MASLGENRKQFVARGTRLSIFSLSLSFSFSHVVDEVDRVTCVGRPYWRWQNLIKPIGKLPPRTQKQRRPHGTHRDPCNDSTPRRHLPTVLLISLTVYLLVLSMSFRKIDLWYNLQKIGFSVTYISSLRFCQQVYSVLYFVTLEGLLFTINFRQIRRCYVRGKYLPLIGKGRLDWPIKMITFSYGTMLKNSWNIQLHLHHSLNMAQYRDRLFSVST